MVKKKIFVIEDHPLVVKGLTQVINKQKDLEVVGYTSLAQKALELIKELNPDLVTMDLSLKDSFGLELIKDIVTYRKDLPILVITMHDENIFAERVLKAGAKGYIMKEKVTKELIKAIYKVLEGNIYVSDEIQSKLLSYKNRDTKELIDILSDRELEVFQLLAEGLTSKEIAAKTNLGLKTVETYKSKIKEKLNIKSNSQLIKCAVEWRLTGILPQVSEKF